MPLGTPAVPSNGARGTEAFKEPPKAQHDIVKWN